MYSELSLPVFNSSCWNLSYCFILKIKTMDNYKSWTEKLNNVWSMKALFSLLSVMKINSNKYIIKNIFGSINNFFYEGKLINLFHYVLIGLFGIKVCFPSITDLHKKKWHLDFYKSIRLIKYDGTHIIISNLELWMHWSRLARRVVGTIERKLQQVKITPHKFKTYTCGYEI